jgi:hypothetical protein
LTRGRQGCYGPPTVLGRTWPPEGLDRAEEFAEPEGRAVPLPVGRPEVLTADPLAADALADDALDGAEACGLDRSEPEAVVAGERVGVAGAVAGLNVATDSMAPATRQTARMLASSGITAPCAANGLVSFRSRPRRRRARSSRW